MPLPSVFEEIDRLFDELIHRRWGARPRQLVPAQFREVDDGWVIELPVEGLRPEDLKVEVQGRRLTVAGRRRSEESRGAGKTGRLRTQQEVSFQQTITLPEAADTESIDAKIEGSTLTIHVRRRPR